MSDSSDRGVHHNPAASRYELSVKGYQCVADYELKDGQVVFTHTFVPEELRGLGLAEKLVRTALGDAREKGLKVIPACSYVAKFIQRHAEFHDLVVK